MKLNLVDWSPDVAMALEEAFAPHPEVSVEHASLLDVAHDTLVSPANSYGHMDGGIDKVYVEHFGGDLQRRVHDAIARRADGKLRVGSALLVDTGHATIPRLIVAPTMEFPGPIRPPAVWFAMSACLKATDALPDSAEVFCPGFGTGIGGLEPAMAAREMAGAYKKWKARGDPSGHDHSPV